MKKLALAICLLVVSIAAQAQFEKGKMILNPSVTGLDFSYNKNDKATFGIGAQAGTFLADGIALMVNVGADWSKPVDEYTLGTGMRFYFNSTGVYLGGGLDWNRFRFDGGSHRTDWGLGIEAGYAYFLSRTVTIEPAVYYKWRFNDSDMSRFGIKVGFGFYFYPLSIKQAFLSETAPYSLLRKRLLPPVYLPLRYFRLCLRLPVRGRLHNRHI